MDTDLPFTIADAIPVIQEGYTQLNEIKNVNIGSIVGVRDRFINGTQKRIIMELEDQTRLSIDPDYNQNRLCGLVVRREYTIPYRHILQSIATLNQSREVLNVNSPAALLLDALNNIPRKDYGLGGVFSVTFDYHIDKTEIFNKSCIYLKLNNSIIFLEDVERSVVHPFSSLHQLSQRFNSAIFAIQGSSIGIEIVANSGEVGPKWANLSGTVTQIFPIKNRSRESGIYCTTVTHNEFGVKSEEIKHFDFNEGIAILGLYNTKEEAEEMSDKDTLRARRIKEIEFSHKEAVIELDRIRLENSRLNEQAKIQEEQRKAADREHETSLRRIVNEHELRLNQLRAEQEAVKQTHEIQQTYLNLKHKSDIAEAEKKAAERRAQSENIKLGVSIITSAAAVYVLMKKNEKK